MKNSAKMWVAAIAAVVLAWGAAGAQTSSDPLKSGFENPPQSARPRVWWHWMNGNISKEGIKLDLEWMHRVGLGGFQNFDAALETPQVVDHRLAYMTPEWKDAFKYATTLADQFGMEEAIAGSPGLERVGRALGSGVRGHEEICVERDVCGGRQAIHRQARASAVEHRELSELSMHEVIARRKVRPGRRSFMPMRRWLPIAVPKSDAAAGSAACKDHFQRRRAGCEAARAMATWRKRPSCQSPRWVTLSWIQYEFAAAAGDSRRSPLRWLSRRRRCARRRDRRYPERIWRPATTGRTSDWCASSRAAALPSKRSPFRRDGQVLPRHIQAGKAAGRIPEWAKSREQGRCRLPPTMRLPSWRCTRALG